MNLWKILACSKFHALFSSLNLTLENLCPYKPSSSHDHKSELLNNRRLPEKNRNRDGRNEVIEDLVKRKINVIFPLPKRNHSLLIFEPMDDFKFILEFSWIENESLDRYRYFTPSFSNLATGHLSRKNGLRLNWAS